MVSLLTLLLHGLFNVATVLPKPVWNVNGKKKEAWTIPRASLIKHFVSRYLCECGIREHTLFLRLWVSKRRSHGHGVPVWHVRWRHGDESGASYTAL